MAANQPTGTYGTEPTGSYEAPMHVAGDGGVHA